jgi:hypothetical protein
MNRHLPKSTPAAARASVQFLPMLFCVLGSAAALAQNDVVVIANEGRLIGEIRSLDRGKLRFKTDATDTIQIDWTNVASLVSDQSFLVTLSDGRQLFGTWSESGTDSVLRLNLEEAQLDLPLLLVTRMTPIEGRLVDRIDMSVDLGYNASKANAVSQTDFSFSFNYRSEERLISMNVDASRSSSASQENSLRENNTIGYRRFAVDRNWDPQGFGAIERNDQLGLDRRMTIGGGMSRWLTDTNSRRINFTGGVVFTRENEAQALESDQSLEAVAGMTLDWFRYDDPELDVAVRLTLFNRLSKESRTRGNLDVDLRWELINDFFWGFSLYYSFNTEPTGVDTSREDYGIVTSVGWSF